MKRRHVGFLYVLPWFIGFLAFTCYPFFASFYYSLTDYNMLSPANFIGLDNYKALIKDQEFIDTMVATFKYVIMTVPFKLAFALFIAFILNFKLRGINFFRTAYYIPSILGGNVAIAVLWKFLFQEDGLINQIIKFFGGGAVPWFSQPTTAMITLSLLRVWEFGSAMVIFLAALKNIPTELYEAAEVDGATKLTTFIRVTIPMLTPVIFFNLVMQMIQAFQEFNSPYLITGGGPLHKTYLVSMMIYDEAFKNYSMGFASAVSWVLFVVIMIFTAFVFKSSSYWVYYSDGGEDKK